MQVVVLPIAERNVEHGRYVERSLVEAGVRAQLDSRNETLNFKIREAETQKVPLMLVIGNREQEAGTATLRLRGARKSDSSPVAMSVEALVAELSRANTERRRDPIS